MAEPSKAKSVLQCQVKLKLRPAQERMLDRWLFRLTGVWNWAVRKIELDSRDGIFHRSYALEAQLIGHGAKMSVPGHVVQDTVRAAVTAWDRCFRTAQLETLRARVYSLVDRGAHICAEFQPQSEVPVSCGRCGYIAEVHLLRDALATLEGLAELRRTLDQMANAADFMRQADKARAYRFALAELDRLVPLADPPKEPTT